MEFGVFEDGDIIAGGFIDEPSAEEHMERLQSLPLAGAGTYDVRQLCPEHDEHGVDECTDFAMLTRVLDLLKR